jgi:hypothetical protein
MVVFWWFGVFATTILLVAVLSANLPSWKIAPEPPRGVRHQDLPFAYRDGPVYIATSAAAGYGTLAISAAGLILPAILEGYLATHRSLRILVLVGCMAPLTFALLASLLPNLDGTYYHLPRVWWADNSFALRAFVDRTYLPAFVSQLSALAVLMGFAKRRPIKPFHFQFGELFMTMLMASLYMAVLRIVWQ